MANTQQDHHESPPQDESALIAARREKLKRWREELKVDPYGMRVDGIIPLAQARAMFDQAAHEEHKAAAEAAKGDPNAKVTDRRPRARVAGRCIQHRLMGKLAFIVLRDHSGDLQVSASKGALDATAFAIASKLDYGDIVVAEGPVGATNKGEICVWADRFQVHCKSLAPPPEKFHGLTDAEIRYRQRYVDMYANPDTMRTMTLRSQIVSFTRRFMEQRQYLEVETPMMQPIAGGAAARPFVTHHNALDIDLFMRVAPELYLKRLLVGGMPRVFEINRNFRNEGIDRSHNPEFTMMEVYEAFADCWSMLELTESLVHEAAMMVEQQRHEGTEVKGHERKLPFGDLMIDYSRPFSKVSYGELFQQALGFAMTDVEKTLAAAISHGVEDARKLDHWLLVNELFERFAEHKIDPAKPTFVTDFPSAISPLTRPQLDHPELSFRWELFIAGMEMANAYTELNDPDVQLEKFTQQLKGADEEAATFRSLDMDFIHALRVGMPPAGGLGVGIDRLIMLLTNNQSIRDVILFPLVAEIKTQGEVDLAISTQEVLTAEFAALAEMCESMPLPISTGRSSRHQHDELVTFVSAWILSKYPKSQVWRNVRKMPSEWTEARSRIVVELKTGQSVKPNQMWRQLSVIGERVKASHGLILWPNFEKRVWENRFEVLVER